jgi:hypothetical protein
VVLVAALGLVATMVGLLVVRSYLR